MMPRLAAASASLVLRICAGIALLVACVSPSSLARDRLPDLIVLADRSPGLPAGQVNAALAELTAQVRRDNPSGQVVAIDYGTVTTTTGIRVSRIAKDLEEAIWSAIAGRDRKRGSALVILSDGRDAGDDPRRAFAAAREVQAPVWLWPVMQTAPDLQFRSISAPATVRLGERVPVTVELAATRALDAELVVGTPDGPRQSRPVALQTGRSTIVRLELDAAHRGAMKIELAVEESGTGTPLAARELLVDVVGPARIAYVGRDPGLLGQSLASGGFEVETIDPRRAPTKASALAPYSLVVLDDIAVHESPGPFWAALVAAVREHGLGLIVLGGPESFGSGGYRDSPLESILPVLSEPAALESPASVVFVVDKSGSMGRSSLAVDRLAHARAAVIETARTLAGQDRAALITFDTKPHVLVPLGSAAEARAALSRPWPVSARGGTLVAPALEAAAGLLAGEPRKDRIILLVTDGFMASEPIAAIQARLAALGTSLIVLAIGADANIAALERLTAATRGTLLRVAEVAELPVLMRLGLQRLRSRVSTGRTPVSQRVALPFLALRDDSWPAISAYAVTRIRPGATAYLTSETGDPLLAAWHAGSGHVVALTAGLGQWTPEWIGWLHWPTFAGGLAGWVDDRQGEASLKLAVEGDGHALKFIVDAADGGRWADGPVPVLRLLLPSGRVLETALTPAGPGRVTARLERPDDGTYTITVIAGQDRLRRLYLHEDRAAASRIGLDPAVHAWRKAGLVQIWPAEGIAAIGKVAGDAASTQAALVALALSMLLLGLLIDYRGSLLAIWPDARRRIGNYFDSRNRNRRHQK
jgi:uncharacterized protein with von Willebrand factor type A (vWA) domain